MGCDARLGRFGARTGGAFRLLSVGNLLHLARTRASGEYDFLTRDGRRTAAQAALTFALQFAEVSVAIAGMRSRGHLGENLAALPLRESELDRIFERGKAHAY